MLELLRIELRTSEARRVWWLLALIGVFGVVTAPVRIGSWVGWWQDTALNLNAFSVIVLGSILSAVAAWTGSRSRVRNTSAWESTTSRPAWQRHAVRMAATWVWTLCAYVGVAMVAHVRTAGLSPVTDPAWLLLLLTPSVLAMQIALGYGVGMLLPSRVTAPLVAVSWYVVVIAHGHVTAKSPEATWLNLLPLLDERWDPVGYTADPARVGAAMLWCFSVTALTLVLLNVRRPWRPSARGGALALGSAALVLSCGVAVVGFDAPLRSAFAQDRSLTTANPCVESAGSQACVWPENQQALPTLRRSLDRVEPALRLLAPASASAPRRFYQRGSRPPGAVGADFSIESRTPDQEMLAGSLLLGALRAALDGSCDSLLGVEALEGYPSSSFVEDFLIMRAGLPARVSSEAVARAVAALRAEPEARQRAWLQRSLEDIRQCRPLELPDVATPAAARP